MSEFEFHTLSQLASDLVDFSVHADWVTCRSSNGAFHLVLDRAHPMSRHQILATPSTVNPRTGHTPSSHKTSEDMIATMSQRELQQLVHDLGFEPTAQLAALFQQLVGNLAGQRQVRVLSSLIIWV